MTKIFLIFLVATAIFSQEGSKKIILLNKFFPLSNISKNPEVEDSIKRGLKSKLEAMGFQVIETEVASPDLLTKTALIQNATLAIDGQYSKKKDANLDIYSQVYNPKTGFVINAYSITDQFEELGELKLDPNEIAEPDSERIKKFINRYVSKIATSTNLKEQRENLNEHLLNTPVTKEKVIPVQKEDVAKMVEEVFKILGEDMVTTATKRAQSLREVPGTVYVVTAEDIRKYGYRDLKDILMRVPGIEMQLEGGFYRGGSRGYIGGFGKPLTMVNGKEVNWHKPLDAFISYQFRANNILRVEIVQGPASALYGANAFTGIINVITKESAVEKNSGHFYGMGGDYRTYEGGFADKRKIGEHGSLQVEGYTFYTKGENFRSFFSNTNPKNLIFLGDYYPVEDTSKGTLPYPVISTGAATFGGIPPFSDTKSSQRIKEIYPSRDPNTFYPFINMGRSHGGNAEFAHKYFYAGVDYHLFQTNYQSSATNADSNFFQERNLVTGYLGFRSLPLFAEVKTSAEFFVQREDIRQQFQYSTSIAEFDSSGDLVTTYINPFALGMFGNDGNLRYKGFLQFEKDFSNIGNYLIFGIGYDRLNVATSISNFLPGFTGSYATYFAHGNPAPWARDETPFYKQYKTGVYIQDQQYFFDRSVQITLGSRYDVHNIYGGVFNPRIGLVYTPKFLKQNTFKLLYGTAFREPSVFEYSTNFDYLTSQLTSAVDTGIPALDEFLVNRIRELRTTQPEKIRTFEIAWVTSPFTWLTHTLTGYRNWGENIIVKRPSPDGITLAYGNEGNRRVDGFESSLKAKYKDFGAFSAYSHYTKTEGARNYKYIESKDFIFLNEYQSSYPLKIADRHLHIHPRHFTAGIDYKLSFLGKYAPTISVEHIWKDSMYTNATDENKNPVKVKTPIFRQTNITVSFLDFNYFGEDISYDLSFTVRNVNNYKNMFVNTDNSGTDLIYFPAEGRTFYCYGRARF